MCLWMLRWYCCRAAELPLFRVWVPEYLCALFTYYVHIFWPLVLHAVDKRGGPLAPHIPNTSSNHFFHSLIKSCPSPSCLLEQQSAARTESVPQTRFQFQSKTQSGFHSAALKALKTLTRL